MHFKEIEDHITNRNDNVLVLSAYTILIDKSFNEFCEELPALLRTHVALSATFSGSNAKEKA